MSNTLSEIRGPLKRIREANIKSEFYPENIGKVREYLNSVRDELPFFQQMDNTDVNMPFLDYMLIDMGSKDVYKYTEETKALMKENKVVSKVAGDLYIGSKETIGFTTRATSKKLYQLLVEAHN